MRFAKKAQTVANGECPRLGGLGAIKGLKRKHISEINCRDDAREGVAEDSRSGMGLAHAG